MNTKDITRENRKMIITAERLVNIVIFFAGVILVLVGVCVFETETQSETIAISVGASMMSSAIVAFLSSIYIRKYQAAKELAEYWGLVSIEEHRETMNLRMDDVQGDVRNNYDIMAYGLKSLRESKSREIEEMLQRGAEMRIITVDPKYEGLIDIDAKEKKVEGSTSDSIEKLIGWVEMLNAKFPGKCQIRFSKFLPSEYYCREDNYIYIGPYQYGKESQRVFTMEYKKGGAGFEYYERYFEDLWNDPEYCKE